MTTVNLLYDVALKRLEKGALSESERLFALILEQVPDHADALHGLARIAVEQKMVERALELIEKASLGVSDRPELLITTARAYMGAGRANDAVFCMERAETLRPGNARIHRFAAEAYIASKEPERALHHGAEAVRLDPADPESHARQGDAYLEMRNPSEAVACYDRSIALCADNWKAFSHRGCALLMMGRLREAASSLIFADALRPMETSVLLPLAGVLIDLLEHDDAALILRKLSALSPLDPRVLRYTAMNLLKRGEVRQAIGEFVKLVSVTQDNPDAELQLGDALLKEGKVENAIGVFDGIIEKSPDYLPAHVRKAEAEFYRHALEKGNLAISNMQVHVKSALSIPLWNGEELQGKTIFLYSQFGLDAFNLFIRFVEGLRRKGATVFVECAAPMSALVSSMPAVDTCLLPGCPVEAADFRSPLERLPYLLGISADRMPKTSYFTWDETRRGSWLEALRPISKVKVGVMWRKETDERPDIFRSIPLSCFSALAKRDDLQLVSLQTSCGLEELAAFEFKERMTHLPELENADLKERLAAMAALDLLIVPDSLSAQTAVAAGLPVWVLVSAAPAWYYGQDGDETIWLPSARLFRQRTIGRWDDVIDAVGAALQQKIGSTER